MKEGVRLLFIKDILETYQGDEPLHHFLRNYYKKHRQIGSRDRKFYHDVVYKYFRAASMLQTESLDDALCISGYLTTDSPADFYQHLLSSSKHSSLLKPTWDQPLREKINLLITNNIINPDKIFPHAPIVDTLLNKEEFFLSRFTQPDLFIRTDLKSQQQVKTILESSGVPYMQNGNCFEFAQQVNLELVLPSSAYEVQDISSQETIQLFNLQGHEKIWDCCSGSGGKSLMLMDKFPDIRLWCSDKRDNILDNLKSRFREHGISAESVFRYDATDNNAASIPGFPENDNGFDLILADMPCSGSGTWSRTPERYSYVPADIIDHYTSIQKKIIHHILPFLKPGGTLVYITCSVYSPENTGMISFAADAELKLIHQQYFEGYKRKGDTLFGAVMMKITD
jgi:16S rRNA (cytosine967-C5)-methyltransferase